MAQQRFTEIKVGVFLLVALAMAVGLIMQFGKLTQFGKGTYEITVVFPNASGIIKDANVLYAGIVVGKVREMELDQTGALRVKVKLAIAQGVKIRRDAQFIINQSGLLGDHFVDITPQSTTAEFISPGARSRGHHDRGSQRSDAPGRGRVARSGGHDPDDQPGRQTH